ncbi:MAG: hypothetical protein JWR38_928 [Mucilaginibacter sp.]|nr:hypothetical protein [Mucilaginibacter sp.]
MPLNTTMTGFDMVYAITQDTVNKQLALLSGQTIPEKVTIGDSDNDGGSLTATLLPPVIKFNTGIPHEAYLCLTFNDGMFTYWSGQGNNSVQKTAPVSGWTIVFNVKINIAQIAQDNIKAAKGIPVQIADMLGKFDPSMFSVQNIFIDFESSDLSTFSSAMSSLPGIDDATKIIFNKTIRLWLLDHKGTDNPFILGFPVTAKQPSGSSDAVFAPAGANLSTHGYEYGNNPADGSKDGLSTLNFLLVTGNRNILSDPSLMRADAGSFHKNLVDKTGIDGKAIIAQEVFFQNYLYNLIVAPLGAQLLSLPDYVHARPDRSPNVDINDKTHGFVQNGNSWHYGDHVKLSWHESGSASHDRESEQNLQYDVQVLTAPDASGQPRLTVNISGSMYRYEWDQQNIDIKGPFGITIKSNVYVGKGWANATMSFNIKLQFVANGNGQISITSVTQQNPPQTDSGTSGVYEFADFFNGILGLNSISSDWANNAGSLRSIEGGITGQLISSVGPTLDNAMSKIILCGGSGFSYQNIQLNADNDIEIDLLLNPATLKATYKEGFSVEQAIN